MEMRVYELGSSYWSSDVFFFFFKLKTAYEMRISDWSSDVCSSDLHERMRRSAGQGRRRDRDREGLESLRLRQRRHEAASRRAAGVRSRYRDAVPLRRSLPDVLPAH